MPRTTLNIDGSVLAELKKRQHEEHLPLGDLVSKLLAQAMSGSSERSTPDFTWSVAPMQARVDLEDTEALQQLLDGS